MPYQSPYSYNPAPNPYYNPQPYQPFAPASTPLSQVTPQLHGRTVSQLNDVTPQDVPMDGSMAFFPLSDGTAVFGKRYNSDGTITTVRYAPEPTKQPQEEPDFNKYIIDRLDSIEEAIEGISKQGSTRRTRRAASDDSDA